MNRLTKTQFLHFLECPYEFQFIASNPKVLPAETEGDMLSIEEGFRFEKEVVNLLDFDNALPQYEFKTGEYYAKADLIQLIAPNEVIFYETKASTQIKEEHYWDIAFQKYVAEAAGYQVTAVFLVLANKEYDLEKNTLTKDLFVVHDITETIKEYSNHIPEKAQEAYNLLQEGAVPKNNHACANRVDCHYLIHNNEIPEWDISLIPRLNKTKFWDLWDQNIRDIKNIPEDYPLSKNQEEIADIIRHKKTIVKGEAIAKELRDLSYPLYFLDYETYAPSVPIFNGYSPYERFVFQYSLHVVEKAGADPTHFEYILESSNLKIESLIDALRKQIGSSGTIIVWNASFEKKCNALMGEHYSNHTEFFEDLNARIFDLMTIFSNGLYVDYRFKGSNSIKKVLPVLALELDYGNLNITTGEVASYRWKKAVIEKHEDYEEQAVLKDLLRYCKLDTYAMVAIYQKLVESIR